ncbi:hypothetical protein Sru01_26280 [Sphaerisporangium rufum]|uniref:DUF4352 domain-containing protein n=1 Tax=Sphaerisporangium rufum TaxID=1381558 RepID=A0A919R0R5_9ACTN|nr:hypothetical protein [Sphaerisporangium rufum]GII77646.1 hypothetical protein Sru01_26280 [Sphaerisporangium rufum]
MTAPESSPAGARRGPLRPWIIVTAVLFALGTVLALAWPAGGLREQRDEVPHRKAGQTTTGHRFAIKPYKPRYVTKDPGPALGDPKPGRFLVLEFDVRNVGHDTASVTHLAEDLSPVLSPGGRALDRFKDRTAGFVVRDAHTDRDQLQPGLPERVMMVYTVPAGLPDPTNVTLTFRDHVYQAGFQTDLPEWLPGENLAVYDLVVGR